MNKIISLVERHNQWRRSCVNLIASENVMSPTADDIYVSDLMHRYAEGLPFGRYYQGAKYFDQIEDLTTKEFKEHFNARFADLRPISGTSANMAVFAALGKRGDKIITLGIGGGSHVSHEKPGAAGLLGLEVHHFDFNEEIFNIDLEKAKKKILEVQPRFIVVAGSVILFPQPVKELKKVCEKTGAKIIYDAAHVFGLIAAGLFQDPLAEGADIITASTHKTFPGPQGGIILGNVEEGLQKKIQQKVFPGVLSNHHLHRIPPLHLTLQEMKKSGEQYANQTISNAKALAVALSDLGFDVLGRKNGFTESHQTVVNVKENGGGDWVAKTLEGANIILNKNIIPGDKIDPESPAGIRIGVQEMTRFGMKEQEMKQIAQFIKEVVQDKEYPEKIKEKVVDFRKGFQEIRYCFQCE